MLPLLQSNVLLNKVDQLVEPLLLKWGEILPKRLQSIRPQVVLAADCVYFEPAFPLLLTTLRELIGEETVCYFCFKKRRRADMHFVRKLRKHFLVEDVDDDPDKAVWSRDSIFLSVPSNK